MSRKRILILITNLTFGGAQRVFYEQSRLLAKNHDVVECVFNLADGHAFPTGNKIISLNVPPGINVVDKMSAFFSTGDQATEIKKRIENGNMYQPLGRSRSGEYFFKKE